MEIEINANVRIEIKKQGNRFKDGQKKDRKQIKQLGKFDHKVINPLSPQSFQQWHVQIFLQCDEISSFDNRDFPSRDPSEAAYGHL